jgi:DNA-binding NtrC family response regulator
MVAAGRFREDLYYRLNVINLTLPSLRQRPSDIPALAMHFLKRYAEENGKTVSSISDAALTLLANHPWPGNVRELENVIERAVVIAEGDALEPHHLPPEFAVISRRGGAPPIPGATLDEIERFSIMKTLESVGGSTSRAADMLGISVRKIQYKLQEYGAAPKSHVPALAEGEADPARSATGSRSKSTDN